jgi:hypothetical protein
MPMATDRERDVYMHIVVKFYLTYVVTKKKEKKGGRQIERELERQKIRGRVCSRNKKSIDNIWNPICHPQELHTSFSLISWNIFEASKLVSSLGNEPSKILYLSFTNFDAALLVVVVVVLPTLLLFCFVALCEMVFEGWC